MHNRRILPLLVLLLLGITACKEKQLYYEIDGTTRDGISGEAIPGMTITLYQKQYNQNVLNNNYILVGSTTSDSEGHYTFTIAREKIYDLKFEVRHDDYYEKDFVHSQDELQTNTINTFNFDMEAEGMLRFIIQNPVVKPQEQLNLYKSGFREGCLECCENGGVSFFEMGDTTFSCAVVGGSTVHIDFGEVTASTSFSEDITCKRFGTTTYTISY